MNVCGLWQGVGRLAAVIADEDGSLRAPITVRATPQNTHHLLDYLVTAGIDTLILAERNHGLIAQAHERRLFTCALCPTTCSKPSARPPP